MNALPPTMIRGCVTCGEGKEEPAFLFGDKVGLDVKANEYFPAGPLDQKLADMGFRRASTPVEKPIMAVICSDGILREVHGGECNAKFMLTDLSRATDEEREMAAEYLGDLR